MTERTELGLEIEAGLREAIAHRRGDIALPTRNVDPMPPERVKAIRKSVARSPREFEIKFGVPARTIEGWEQGRRQPDPAARALLEIIEKEPAAARRALAHA